VCISSKDNATISIRKNENSRFSEMIGMPLDQIITGVPFVWLIGIRGVRQHLGCSEHWEIAPPSPISFGKGVRVGCPAHSMTLIPGTSHYFICYFLISALSINII